MDDTISRKAAIEALNEEIIKRRLLGNVNDGMLDEFDTESILRKLPSAQPERWWETCFDCPLSHGCPKIKGCTNEQAEQYASEIPDGCPLSAQSDNPDMIKEIRKWINSGNRGIADYFIVDKIEEVLNKYEWRGEID